MRKLITLFLLLLFAIWLGWIMQHNSGYVLVTNGQWQIETSLWMAIIILVLAFIIFYFLMRILVRTSTLGKQWSSWRHLYRQRRGQHWAELAACALAENHWPQAEDYLCKAIANSSKPLLHYMAAAVAAQQQNADQRRDDYLQKAFMAAKEAEISLGFLQAQLQIQGQQWQSALFTLKKLQQSVPHHPLLTKLLDKCIINT